MHVRVFPDSAEADTW